MIVGWLMAVLAPRRKKISDRLSPLLSRSYIACSRLLLPIGGLEGVRYWCERQACWPRTLAQRASHPACVPPLRSLPPVVGHSLASLPLGFPHHYVGLWMHQWGVLDSSVRPVFAPPK